MIPVHQLMSCEAKTCMFVRREIYTDQALFTRENIQQQLCLCIFKWEDSRGTCILAKSDGLG